MTMMTRPPAVSSFSPGLRSGATALGMLLLTAATLGGLACFSEREPTAPQASGTCTIPLDDNTLGSTIVAIKDLAFHPATVRVKAGERVTWVNCDDPGNDAHTSTSDASGWSSPLLSAGQSFTHTFTGAGSFPYHCEPHPSMTGTVTVE